MDRYFDGEENMKTPEKELDSKPLKAEELKKWYKEELERRDKEIEELKEKNTILMKASLNSSKKIADLTEKLEKAIKK
ncbi:hypothetical protein GF361_05655 [Candidatus Woesearchaeota archaeon]|nr:hypothetical protein [Candidatus Woesearchaeota archaeon]